MLYLISQFFLISFARSARHPCGKELFEPLVKCRLKQIFFFRMHLPIKWSWFLMKLNYKAGRVHGNWSKQNYKVITACTWIVYRSTINHFNRSRCHFSCCCGFVTVFLHIHCRCRREMKKKYAQPKKVFVYKNRMHKNAFEAKER